MLGMSRGAWIRPWAWALALAGLLAITAPAALAQAVATSGGANPPPLRKGTGLPVPRFATVRAEETNVRTGPGPRYPIDWVFKRKGMPVEIVGEYENYRKIRDWQGAGGWVHASLLTGKRYVIVTTANAPLRKTPATSAAEVARMEVEVVAQVKSCSGDWCRVQASGHVGWIERRHVWGVYRGEVVN